MSNWYGIPGIEFHSMGPWADFEITFDGVRDDAGVIAEMTLWDMYTEDGGTDPFDGFEAYMSDNAGTVKDMIRLARGEAEV